MKSLSRVRLCDPMDCSLPGSSVHGVFQARVLEWVAISFFRGPSWPSDRTQVSCIAGRHFTSEPPGKPTKALCMYIKGSDYISLSSLSGSWASCVSAMISTFSFLIYSPFSATNNPVSSASCASFPHFIICLLSLLYHGLVMDSCSTWWLPFHPWKHFS